MNFMLLPANLKSNLPCLGGGSFGFGRWYGKLLSVAGGQETSKE